MADEATTGAGLFKEIGEGGSGSYYRAKSGDMAIGEFRGTSDAGEQEFEQKKSRGIWWHFDLYKFSDPSKRIRYTPEDGPDKGKEIEASTDGRTTDEMGPKSKARGWFTALLQREITKDDKTAKVYAEALGKRVIIVFGPSASDATKIIVAQVLPYRAED